MLYTFYFFIFDAFREKIDYDIQLNIEEKKMTKFEDFPLVMFNKNKIVKKLNSFLEKFNAATNEFEAYTIYKKYRNYIEF